MALKDYKWINEPEIWKIKDDALLVETGKNTDFWAGTWYNFYRHSGHFYGRELKGDFTYQACIEAGFSEKYDQAGLMIYRDERNWLKAGIEFNDGQPAISSVLTKDNMSDWATGIFPGFPGKFWLRISKVGNVICVKYSCDKSSWYLLRLCQLPEAESCFVGPMCCTPERSGLEVKFSEIEVGKPIGDILHGD
ncbi:regulation of enolase protein 1 [Plutella xylostella]|uniref:regulation of enolase protein 1 n=1 Tax=Plutella xylostella TaxID=51655 RepID=UPI00203281B0|nr:regulation of enolase protein 1 [Plutella xylostella]